MGMTNGDKVKTADGKSWYVENVGEGVIVLVRGFGVLTERRLVIFGSADHRGIVR